MAYNYNKIEDNDVFKMVMEIDFEASSNSFPICLSYSLSHVQVHVLEKEARLGSPCRALSSLRPGPALGSPSAEQLLLAHSPDGWWQCAWQT